MKLATTVLLAAAFGVANAAAQTANQGAKPTFVFRNSVSQAPGQGIMHTTIVALPADSGCPVTMRAQHLADGSLVKTGGAHPNDIGQWLHLSLTSRDSRQIAKATIAVHGLTAKGRMTQTLAAGDGSSDAMRNFNVSFSAGDDRAAHADIWVAGMSAVERIDVNSVVYGDGSMWKIAEDSSCHVKPDSLMLITNR